MNTRSAIERRIQEYLTVNDHDMEWIKSAVRKHDFLPLYLGWTAVLGIGIRPDGFLIRWDHEEDREVVKPLNDDYWQRMALRQGAKAYPELGVLVPQRPRSAQDCEACGGTGDLQGSSDIVCQCGGLGWVIPGEQREPSPG